MENVDDVAAAFLGALGPMEAMKLEKLVYYAQAWSVAAGQGPLFTHQIQAWTQGPVVPYLYRQHRQQWMVHQWPSGDGEELRSAGRAVIRSVIDRYGEMSARELSRLTHAETPWLEARGDLPDDAAGQSVIQLSVLKEYYGRQISEPAAAVRHAIGNAALEGLSVPDGFDAVLAEVADGTRRADDVVAELVASLTASQGE